MAEVGKALAASFKQSPDDSTVASTELAHGGNSLHATFFRATRSP